MNSELFFPGTGGFEICGLYSAPSDAEGKRLVILCHGFASSKNSGTNQRLVDFLEKKGFHSFRFDFFGHGESGGEFADITITKAVADIISSHRYFYGKGYREFGLIGSSFGGLASILAAPDLTGLKWLGLKSPVSDYLSRLFEEEGEWDVELWKRQGFHTYTDFEGKEKRLNYGFYIDATQRSGYDAAPKIRVPTFVVHGGEDEIVTVDQSQKLAGLIPKCRLEIIPGADHGYSKAVHFERMIGFLQDFILL
jgi:uncharacterized protein